MARIGRYFPPVISGFTVWTVGAGLKCLFNTQTPLWTVIVALIVEGSGIGLILQPSKITHITPLLRFCLRLQAAHR